MKFTLIFLAPVHSLKIKDDLGEGLEIVKGIFLSNSIEFLEREILSEDLKGKMGSLNYNELKEMGIFAYWISTIHSDEPISYKNKTKQLETKLRVLVDYLSVFWFSMDNSVDASKGFMDIIDENNNHDIGTSDIPHSVTKSNGHTSVFVLDKSDIENSIKYFHFILKLRSDEFDTTRVEEEYQDLVVLSRAIGIVTRAGYFIFAARTSRQLPAKILSYCTCLESLFLREKSELTNKLATRIALFLSKKPIERHSLFKDIKKAYDVRSKMVHGSQREGIKPQDVLKASALLDDVVRRSFRTIIENEELRSIFQDKDNPAFEKYMNELMFGRVENI